MGGKVIKDEQIYLNGQIRAGRSKEVKDDLIDQLKKLLAKETKLDQSNVWVYIVDLEPSQMVEYGEVLPVSGQEKIWFENLPDKLKKKLKSLDEKPEEKAEGGRIGLDAGGPPISPANLHPLQRPMFYQGGLTKTVPPKKGPMPQGLQSDVYDGIMRPGVINGRN